MSSKLTKIRPKRGLAHAFHLLLTFLLPLLVYVMVATNIAWAGLMLILLSKWRMLAVKPRHWPANIRANAIDLLVGVSILIFMIQSGSHLWQLLWVAVYGAWLLVLKPGSGVLRVSLQALAGLLFGLTALFLRFGDINTTFLVFASWGISYLVARHFFASFDEPQTRFFSYLWGYFAGALVWLLSHYLLSRGPFFQPVLLINVIGFCLGTLYYLQETDKLSSFYQRQILFIALALVVILVTFPFLFWDKAF
jgi:hypothetical protein